MLWKQAPPIRLGQQANKRGQDQHDEIGRRNTIETEHDNERCLFWLCCWRTSRSWEGRLGCARKEQQEWSAKPWNCESLKNNLCHIHLIMMFKNIHLIMMFKMIFWSQPLCGGGACSSGPRDNAQDDDVLIQKKTSAVVIKDIWERARVTHIIQSIPDSIVHTWYLCSKWW